MGIEILNAPSCTDKSESDEQPPLSLDSIGKSVHALHQSLASEFEKETFHRSTEDKAKEQTANFIKDLSKIVEDIRTLVNTITPLEIDTNISLEVIKNIEGKLEGKGNIDTVCQCLAILDVLLNGTPIMFGAKNTSTGVR